MPRAGASHPHSRSRWSLFASAAARTKGVAVADPLARRHRAHLHHLGRQADHRPHRVRPVWRRIDAVERGTRPHQIMQEPVAEEDARRVGERGRGGGQLAPQCFEARALHGVGPVTRLVGAGEMTMTTRRSATRRAARARQPVRRPRRAACRAGSCHCLPGWRQAASAAWQRPGYARKLRYAVEHGDESGIGASGLGARRQAIQYQDFRFRTECGAQRNPLADMGHEEVSQPSRTSAGPTIDAPRP